MTASSVLTVGIPPVTTSATALLLLALTLTLASHRATGRGSRGQRHTASRAGPHAIQTHVAAKQKENPAENPTALRTCVSGCLGVPLQTGRPVHMGTPSYLPRNLYDSGVLDSGRFDD